MKKLLLLVLVAALGYVAWPYWCVYSLSNGVKTGDRSALERYVDWPALRQSVRDEMIAATTAQTGGAAGGQTAWAVDYALSMVLTPEAMANAALQAQRSGGVSGASGDANVGGLKPAGFSRENVKWAFFESPTRFVVHLAPNPDREELLKLRFHLVDYVWKLSDVDLPQGFNLNL